MAVKVITDSTAGLSREIAREWDIGVVPIYVRFGDDVYREGIHIAEGTRMMANFPKKAVRPKRSAIWTLFRVHPDSA